MTTLKGISATPLTTVPDLDLRYTVLPVSSGTGFNPVVAGPAAFHAMPSLTPARFPKNFRPLMPDFRKSFADRWACFCGRRERLDGSLQLAAPGYTVPVKASLTKEAWFFRSHPLENVRVRFTAITPDGLAVDLGDAVTDMRGDATVYFSPDSLGDYRIVAVRDDGAETAVSHGLLSVISQDKPVVILDVDELIKRHGLKDALASLDGDTPTFRVVGMTLHGNTAEKLRQHGAVIPVIVNDYHDSPFKRDKLGFAETQLEKLKRLKFENGLPVVGVVTRPMQSDASFYAAGIYPTVPGGGYELFELESTLNRDFLLSAFNDFKRRIAAPQDEYYWDGLTQSAMVYGNHVRFFTENQNAGRELFRLLEGARTFIHASPFMLYSDRFGRRVFDKLAQRARAGIVERFIIDRLTQIPFPTDNGFTWLDFSTVYELMRAGAEIVYHHVFHPEDSDQAGRGPFVRRHRKHLIVDYADENTPLQILAYGGGRLIGSVSYENLKYEANWLQRKLGIGWGTYRDLSFTIAGPAAGSINRKFMEDFRDYGGAFTASELAKASGPAPLQPQNTGLRPVFHDSYFNQNTHNVLASFLTRPESRDITFVNSFTPSENMADKMITAARNGKKVRWITSSMWGYHSRTWHLIPKLLSAGVEIIVVPYQLHTKLYFNEHFYAFGNQNLDILSQHDAEDLNMLQRDGGEDVQALDAYIAGLLADGVRVNDKYGPDADPTAVRNYVASILNNEPANVTRLSEHSVWEGVGRGLLFLALSPFRWRPSR